MSGENKQKEESKDDSQSTLVKRIFPESNTSVYLHSPTKRNLAYIIIFLQRAVGKENVVYNKPWFNDKKGVWIVEVGVKIPEVATKNYSVVSHSNLDTEA